jgi:thioredoxin-related protein
MALHEPPMKRFILLFTLGWANLSAIGQPLEWLTDAQAAVEKAGRENKFVLLDFTGSDWCGWCIKLKKEVFDQPEFAQYAQANLVLVEVDFPRHKQLDPAQKEANHRLAEKLQITGYPTIILLSPLGQPVGRTGYMRGGPSAFNAAVDHILQEARKKLPARPAEAEAAPSEPQRPRQPVAFAPVPPPVPIHYGSLALKGISGTKDRRLVMINNATLMVGETVMVKAQDRDVVVCCKEIRDDSVLITADDKPMELKLGKR